MASQLPGIDRRAEKVAEHFGSVRAMVEAGEKEWQAIEGIGKVTARAVVRAIREEGA
jgi:ERCC4-type nuclease